MHNRGDIPFKSFSADFSLVYIHKFTCTYGYWLLTIAFTQQVIRGNSIIMLEALERVWWVLSDVPSVAICLSFSTFYLRWLRVKICCSEVLWKLTMRNIMEMGLIFFFCKLMFEKIKWSCFEMCFIMSVIHRIVLNITSIVHFFCVSILCLMEVF